MRPAQSKLHACRRISACEVLYAYAIENVLKGIIVANNPSIANQNKIDSQLKSHDLVELAGLADVTVHGQERPVLQALSELAVWAGRYPVALTKEEFVGRPNPDEMLDYGALNVVMRQFFDRVFAVLVVKLPQRHGRFSAVVVFRPKT